MVESRERSASSPVTRVRERFRVVFPVRSLTQRGSALKERVYASFTGLAIVTVFAMDPDHATAGDAFLALLAGIVGISAAAFVAEAISHLITHAALPTGAEVWMMARTSLGAIASASVAFIALASAWSGVFSLHIALQISVGIYLLTLGLIALIAVHRTGLPLRHKLMALVGLVGFGACVILVLALAH